MDREGVEVWLDFHDVENYTINEDLSVDVSGVVDLSGKSLIVIPIRFGIVGGDFNCDNNKLLTLEFCPSDVGGSFYCFDNKITTNLNRTTFQ